MIAGAMLGKTVTGHTSCDGGSAIISSEAVHFCLPEERTSGIKYAPGFGTSLEAGLDYLSLQPNDLQALVLCTFGESISTDLSYAAAQLPKSMATLSDRLRLAPEHHHLHALLAFRLSGFTEALVLVADNEGLVIGSRHPAVDLKDHPAERTSVYIGSPGAVTLLTRPQWAPQQASLGEAYRKFSYFCGFPSHQLAGKTMALAAYGDPERFRGVRLFEVNAGGDAICLLPNDIGDPILEVEEFFRQHCGLVKRPTSPDEQAARDAAAFVQLELERAVLAIVKAFLSKTRLRHVCISGGIAYNCRLIGRLAREIDAEFFVPPSPGGSGPCARSSALVSGSGSRLVAA
jgi:carbamoyltransferase